MKYDSQTDKWNAHLSILVTWRITAFEVRRGRYTYHITEFLICHFGIEITLVDPYIRYFGLSDVMIEEKKG
jgi:hypothetical protein